MVSELLDYRLWTGIAFLLAIIVGCVRARRRRIRATEELKQAIRFYDRQQDR